MRYGFPQKRRTVPQHERVGMIFRFCGSGERQKRNILPCLPRRAPGTRGSPNNFADYAHAQRFAARFQRSCLIITHLKRSGKKERLPSPQPEPPAMRASRTMNQHPGCQPKRNASEAERAIRTRDMQPLGVGHMRANDFRSRMPWRATPIMRARTK